jgi:hypothetical protein
MTKGSAPAGAALRGYRRGCQKGRLAAVSPFRFSLTDEIRDCLPRCGPLCLLAAGGWVAPGAIDGIESVLQRPPEPIGKFRIHLVVLSSAKVLEK